jgi:hypothetical protein
VYRGLGKSRAAGQSEFYICLYSENQKRKLGELKISWDRRKRVFVIV